MGALNNDVTKDKCSITMDMNIMFGLHKFCLQVTIDHHQLSRYTGHYTNSVNCCNDSQITELGMNDTKTRLLYI